MTIEIDWTRCDGHGLCAELLPEQIIRDEWGFPILLGSRGTAVDRAAERRTVAACPALALRLTERAETKRIANGTRR
jgi:ferredoxin